MWIPYNRDTSISLSFNSGDNSSVTDSWVFLFKPRVGAMCLTPRFRMQPLYERALMLILKTADYDISEGSSTRHDLDRFTSLGTMLSCTVYG